MKYSIYSVESVKLTIVKTNPPSLLIEANGLVPTSGWTEPELQGRIYIQPPPDGIWDFDFVATAPSGIVIEVFTKIYAAHLWQGNLNQLKGVRVHSSTNAVVQMLKDAPEQPPFDLGKGALGIVSKQAPRGA